MSWRTVEVGGEVRVLLAGGITEESDFQSLVEAAPHSLVIDLGAVELINSCGVREWINFVRTLSRRGCSLEMINCSPPIVRQLNMISNFNGNGAIRSVLAPYFCDNCEHDELTQISLSDSVGPQDIDETITCPRCGELMAFDDLPDSYLEFTTRKINQKDCR